MAWWSMIDDDERVGIEAVFNQSRYHLRVCMKGLKKTTKNLNKDSRRPSRGSKRATPEWKPGVSSSVGLLYLFKSHRMSETPVIRAEKRIRTKWENIEIKTRNRETQHYHLVRPSTWNVSAVYIRDELSMMKVALTFNGKLTLKARHFEKAYDSELCTHSILDHCCQRYSTNGKLYSTSELTWVLLPSLRICVLIFIYWRYTVYWCWQSCFQWI